MKFYRAEKIDELDIPVGTTVTLESLRQAVVPPYLMLMPFIEVPDGIVVEEQRALDEDGVHGCTYVLQAAAASDPGKQQGDPNAEAQFQQKLRGVKEEYEKRIKKLEGDQITKTTDLQSRVDELRVSGLKSDVVSGVAGIAADPDEVFTIMNAKGFFKLDEESGKYVVVDPSKQTVQLDVDADGEPLAPGKAAVAWLEEHPRHKRASGRTGSGQGAGEQAGGEGPSSEIDTKSMKPSEIFQRRHEIVDNLRRGG